MNFIAKSKHFISIVLTIFMLLNTSIGDNLLSITLEAKAASSPVYATFYLVDEAKFLSNYPNISTQSDYLVKVGNGTVNYTSMILNDASRVSKLIVKKPSGANYNWCHIVKRGGKYYVGAPMPTTTTTKSPNKTSTANIASTTNTSKSKTHALTKSQILSLSSSSYPSIDNVLWDEYLIASKDVNNGIIPMSLLKDPVYTSMNLPSESQSDVMIQAHRDNGHIVGYTNVAGASQLTNFGGVEITSGETLPWSFSVCLGKIKMFAYSKSQNKWITIDSQPYPTGIYIYTLPWSTTVAKKCTNVEYYSNYAKVNLTSADLKSSCLHFWGRNQPLNNSDYLYYAGAYEIWVSSNVANKLTAGGGIDTKDSTGYKTLSQLYSTRGYSGQSYKKIVWGTTIPNSVYRAEWGTQLQNLFNQ